jgi:hypothetical protein
MQVPRCGARVRVPRHRLDVDQVEALGRERAERVAQVVEAERRHVGVLCDRGVPGGLEPAAQRGTVEMLSADVPFRAYATRPARAPEPTQGERGPPGQIWDRLTQVGRNLAV